MPNVPRNSKGWPVIGPQQMTYLQLIAEARKWKGCRNDSSTTGQSQWKIYTEELLARGFSTPVELQEGVLPDEVPGDDAMRRHQLWSVGAGVMGVDRRG